MTLLDKISYAYAVGDSPGSHLTAPLRRYQAWCVRNIQESGAGCLKLALRVAYMVSLVFAAFCLALPTALGIYRNFYAPISTNLSSTIVPFSPEKRNLSKQLITRGEATAIIQTDVSRTPISESTYSLWAKVISIPEAVDYYLEAMHRTLTFILPEGDFEGYKFCDGGCRELNRVIDRYTYDQGLVLGYSLYCASKTSNTALLSSEEEKQIPLKLDMETITAKFPLREASSVDLTIPSLNNNFQVSSNLPSIADQGKAIENSLRRLTISHNWHPATFGITSDNGHALLLIPVPDHLVAEIRSNPSIHSSPQGLTTPFLLTCQKQSSAVVEMIEDTTD